MRIGIIPDSESAFCQNRVATLRLTAFSVNSAQIQELGKNTADVVYLVPYPALRASNWNALRVKLAHANRQYIVAGQNLSSAEIMLAARDGSADVLDECDSDERWAAAITRAMEHQTVWLELYGGGPVSTDQILIGESPATKALRLTIGKIGPTDVNVLVLGESGVGKEKVAYALHDASGRKNFVALNCAAIPKDLLETELFGVEKGAYTGALKSRKGLVEQAANGTLFLDEIGEMDSTLQPKLLRLIENRVARRVGSETEYSSTARIIAATNRDLRQEAQAGAFRSDLFFRLAEIAITIAPLRDRTEDIPLLAKAFLERANERFGKNFTMIEPELVQRMKSFAWPGNVRELKSVIDRLVLLYDGPVMRDQWWETHLEAAAAERFLVTPTEPFGKNQLPSRKQKAGLAKQLLAESDNNFTWVAGQLGINPTTLWRWRKNGKI